MEIPPTETLHFYQRDQILGDNYNTASYHSAPGEITAHYRNSRKLTYAFLTVVAPQHLNTFIVLTPQDEGCHLYVASFVKTASVPLLKKRISRSFGNRLVAVYNWLLTGMCD